VTAIWSGPGFPLTLHRLLRTYSLGNASVTNPNDPGDRRSAFDFSYRVPGLRNWLTFYGDSFTEDEFSPISFPRKSNFRAGIYMPRLPKLGSGLLFKVAHYPAQGSNGATIAGLTRTGKVAFYSGIYGRSEG
jgi:hypothetical protein